MKLLEEKILCDGKVLPGNILKVDSFLNHQIDTKLFSAMGKDFAEHFKDKGITKVMTLEVSGIALAFTAAFALEVPMIFAKKTPSLTLTEDVYSSEVYSYTKKIKYDIRVDRKFINNTDTVLIIDDFLAIGQALGGMLDICRQADARIAGVGIAIEKAFQGGGDKYRAMGYDVYSLAKIAKFTDNSVVFA